MKNINLKALKCLVLSAMLASCTAADYKRLGDENFSRNPDKAIEYYLESLAIEPGNADVLQRVGRIFLEKKDYQNSASYLIHATEANPNNSLAWNNLGWTYGKLEQYQKMQQSFERAIELEKSAPLRAPNWDLLGLGWAHYYLMNYKNSENIALKVLNLKDVDKSQSEANELLIRAFLAQGKYEKIYEIEGEKSKIYVKFTLVEGEGVLLESVSKGGPADLSGFKKGDVLLSLNGVHLKNIQKAEFVNNVSKLTFGKRAKVLVKRDGSLFSSEIYVGVTPEIGKIEPSSFTKINESY